MNNNLIQKAEEMAKNLQQNDRCVLTPKTKLEHIEMVVKAVKNLNINSEELIIVAYLHDILDYADGEKRNNIEKDIFTTFGSHILDLVKEVSDNFKMEDISTPQGLEAFNTRIKDLVSPGKISDTAAIIILAEKVCNLTDMFHEIPKYGNEAYWEILFQRNSLKKSDIRSYYESIYNNIARRCEQNYRLRDLIDKFDDLMFRIFDNQ